MKRAGSGTKRRSKDGGLGRRRAPRGESRPGPGAFGERDDDGDAPSAPAHERVARRVCPWRVAQEGQEAGAGDRSLAPPDRPAWRPATGKPRDGSPRSRARGVTARRGRPDPPVRSRPGHHQPDPGPLTSAARVSPAPAGPDKPVTLESARSIRRIVSGMIGARNGHGRRSALLSFKFAGTALVGSLAMALVSRSPLSRRRSPCSAHSSASSRASSSPTWSRTS